MEEGGEGGKIKGERGTETEGQGGQEGRGKNQGNILAKRRELLKTGQ